MRSAGECRCLSDLLGTRQRCARLRELLLEAQVPPPCPSLAPSLFPSLCFPSHAPCSLVHGLCHPPCTVPLLVGGFAGGAAFPLFFVLSLAFTLCCHDSLCWPSRCIGRRPCTSTLSLSSNFHLPPASPPCPSLCLRPPPTSFASIESATG